MTPPDRTPHADRPRSDADRHAAVVRFTAIPLRASLSLIAVGLVLMLGSRGIEDSEMAMVARYGGGALTLVALFVLGFVAIIRTANRSPREER